MFHNFYGYPFSYLWVLIRQESVEFLTGRVPHSTPPRSIIARPDLARNMARILTVLMKYNCLPAFGIIPLNHS